jgi:hypothetical protein
MEEPMPWDAVLVPDDDEHLRAAWERAAERAKASPGDGEAKRRLVEEALRAMWPDLVVVDDEGKWTVYRDGAAAA